MADPADRWGTLLGLEMQEVGPERVVATLEVDERHHQPYGIAHGGVYCSLVEGVASYGAGQSALARGLTDFGTWSHVRPAWACCCGVQVPCV